MKKERSIKWKMGGLVLVCWLLPILLMIGVMGYYVFSRQIDNNLEQMAAQLEMDNKVCAERLNNAIQASRKASYDKMLHSEYQNYVSDKTAYYHAYYGAKYYLYQQYSKKKEFSMEMLWLYESPMERSVALFNEASGGSYGQIRTYWEKDHEDLEAFAKELDTTIGFWYRDGRLYLVRNLVDAHYQPWGVLLMRLNMDYCFETLYHSHDNTFVMAEMDGQPIYLKGDAETFADVPEFAADTRGEAVKTRSDIYLQQEMKQPDYVLRTVLKTDRGNLDTPLYGYQYILLGMLLLLVPILLVMVRMFNKNIAKPIETLALGAEEIEKGNLGYQSVGEVGSREFRYLLNSFNHMSQRLKYQFDHIYEEELALRDAKIMALQAHINPHFMNNTLEIINWEARLSGNTKISKMIESLSILLDGAMDRKKQPEVTLSEEMVYVNAYLHITAERLGKRLTVIQDLPEEIMEEKVPRLILQPVIENAIEHGVVPQMSGTVCICGHKEDGCLILEISNNGSLSKEEEEKIEKLLSPEYDSSRESSANLGIANVNQRLRILYGECSGLRIFSRNDNTQIVARLTIHVE